MVFSSAMFLFCFLPVLIVLYFSTPDRFKNVLLLIASLFFYAWGEGVYVLLMVASIVLNYAFGRLIDHFDKPKIVLLAGVSLNLIILISYKYSNFIADNINVLLDFVGTSKILLEPVHLPLGISFFTFQAISYLIDIYRRQIPSQKNVVDLGLYIALFPQLIAGPIVRYKTILFDITDRQHNSEQFAQGTERFVYGLAKKMLIANPLGYVVDLIFDLPGSEMSAHIAWLGIMLYALQIYFDFSGYSDMAIGLGRMFGFRFLENFNYPYISQSLQDFWRRWHISLSSWFRDYLYIPLGGNKVSLLRTYINLFVVFLLCGFWHGASWNFIVWGILHGSVLVIERLGFASVLEGLWRPLRHLYLILVVLITWVFFRADTLSQALDYVAIMFSFNFDQTPFEIIEAINFQVQLAVIFGLLLCMPVFRSFVLPNKRLTDNSGEHISQTYLPITTSRFCLVLTLLFLSIVKLATSTHNPFIYFRF